MKEKAFISIAIFVLFIPALMQLSLMQSLSKNSMNEIEAIALKAEKASLLRKELEINSDKIIRETIINEIKKNNLNHESIKEKISEKLFTYFKGFEETHYFEPKTSFWLVESKGYSYNGLLSGKKKELEMQDIKENSQLIVSSINEGMTFAEFYFTGGIEKDKAIAGLIEFNGLKEFFLLPIGYAQKLEVIG